jgi:rhodanese-related sulfurtransferase
MNHSPEFLKIVNTAKAQVKECNLQDVFDKQKGNEDFVLVDTREDNEWAAGHIPGAIHIGKGVIERDIEALVPDKNKTIILYCGGGFRSALAAQNLEIMGYKNPISMDGGFKAYKDTGLDFEF